jgi:hypothetical protein
LMRDDQCSCCGGGGLGASVRIRELYGSGWGFPYWMSFCLSDLLYTKSTIRGSKIEPPH